MGTSSFAYINNINPTNVNGTMLKATFDPLSVRAVPRGSYLFMPQEKADKMYFIEEGSVKVGTYGLGGKEITKAIYRQGDILGELALLGESHHHNFAAALSRTKVRVIKVTDMRTKLELHHDLHLEIMQIVGQRLLATEQRLESMAFKNSRSRIIEYLYQLAQEQGQRVGYEILVRQFLTHQEIANLTSTSRQTVTTVLNELRNDNVLTFNRKRLLVRDMELLAEKI